MLPSGFVAKSATHNPDEDPVIPAPFATPVGPADPHPAARAGK